MESEFLSPAAGEEEMEGREEKDDINQPSHLTAVRHEREFLSPAADRRSVSSQPA